MAAPTNYYVNPSTGADSAGNGSSGSPYKTMQYALDDIGTTHGRGADGDQVNLDSVAKDTLSSAISLATYGSPTAQLPLIIRGFDDTANDGGVGEIDCGGSNGLFSSAYNFVKLVDLKVHNAGTAHVISLGAGILILRCEVYDTTARAVSVENSVLVQGCNIYDAAYGLYCANDAAFVIGNYFKNSGTTDFTYAIQLSGVTSTAMRNIISVDAASGGINCAGNGAIACNNSLLAVSSSGAGSIGIRNGSGTHSHTIHNNIVEGFVKGIDKETEDETSHSFSANAAYNNGTDYAGDATNRIFAFDDGDNEELTATAFAKDGLDTFANRMSYFAPLDEGNVLGGSFGAANLDKGAVQSAGGGGGGTNVFIPSGLFIPGAVES